VNTAHKGLLLVTWFSGATETIDVQFYPTEVNFDKSAQIAEIGIPGLDSPLLQFVRGQNEKLTLDLFFDTTEDGMGAGARTVAEYTDKIYSLVKIEPQRHAPPVCEFIWMSGFPGSRLHPNFSNQQRYSFRCLVESVKQKFTLFSSEGVPLRATLSVTLREYKTLDQQLAELNLTSPDRTETQVLQRGETLALIAARHYRRAGDWRHIAEANNISDPRRVEPGTFLTLPPTR